MATNNKHLKHHLQKAVVAHKSNHYRPHIVRVQGLMALGLLIASIQLSYLYTQSGAVLGSTVNHSTQQLLQETNKQRQAVGAEALVLDKALSAAASHKASNMFQDNYWAHTSPTGITPWHWFAQEGYSYSVAGENLAKNFRTPQAIVAAWMNSPEHRRNMLDVRYKDVGFAVQRGELQGKKTTLIVALYGTPKTDELLPTGVLAASNASFNLISRFGIGLKQLNPSVLASIFLLMLAMLAALFAHAKRAHLPKAWRTSWRRHHGVYSAAGLVAVALFIVLLYGGGQI